jgi:hypothetical protein
VACTIKSDLFVNLPTLIFAGKIGKLLLYLQNLSIVKSYNLHVFNKIIFGNKFDLFWVKTLFLEPCMTLFISVKHTSLLQNGKITAVKVL